MAESLILKSQASEIFQLIESVQLIPQDFKWETVDSFNTPYLKVSKLIHISTKYYFQFDFGASTAKRTNTGGVIKTTGEYLNLKNKEEHTVAVLFNRLERPDNIFQCLFNPAFHITGNILD